VAFRIVIAIEEENRDSCLRENRFAQTSDPTGGRVKTVLNDLAVRDVQMPSVRLGVVDRFMMRASSRVLRSREASRVHPNGKI
jgi:hypothetical protein